MYLHRILHVARIPACENNTNRNVRAAKPAHHQVIPPAEPLMCQLERPELVFLEGISAREVEYEIGAKTALYPLKRPGQLCEILFVADAVVKSDIEVALLFYGIITLLMDGKGKDIRIILEYMGGTVSLVKITVNDGYTRNLFLSQHLPAGYCDIIEKAKPFSMIREGVMVTSCEIDCAS
jgi:hypothetical protein